MILANSSLWQNELFWGWRHIMDVTQKQMISWQLLEKHNTVYIYARNMYTDRWLPDIFAQTIKPHVVEIMVNIRCNLKTSLNTYSQILVLYKYFVQICDVTQSCHGDSTTCNCILTYESTWYHLFHSRTCLSKAQASIYEQGFSQKNTTSCRAIVFSRDAMAL